MQVEIGIMEDEKESKFNLKWGHKDAEDLFSLTAFKGCFKVQMHVRFSNKSFKLCFMHFR